MNIDIDQYLPTHELAAGIPEWVGMLAIWQCVRAGDHDRDYPGACRAHLLEARRLAAWLAGSGSESDWDVPL